MKITKDTQLVWFLQNGHTIIGRRYRDYFVRTTHNLITVRNKTEMIEVYGLTEDQFANIEKSGI